MFCTDSHEKTAPERMEFLSTVTNQLPPAPHESQSDLSGDDLQISDDSVLDDLYTGLPPSYVG